MLWDWFPLDDLPHPLYFPSERVIQNYQAGRLYDPSHTMGAHR
jgi:hypothetical protein